MTARALRRALALAAFGAVLGGTGLGWGIGVADASPETDFLDGLTDHGMTVYDASTAVGWGWAICGALDSTTGDVVAENFYQITNGDIPDRYTAGVWVIEAVVHLCPWHDNSRDGRMVV